MKRRKLPPDNRLDWRDPDMPVLRMVRYSDNEPFRLGEVSSKAITRYYENKMMFDADGPEWNRDPTYDLKKYKNN